MQHSGRLKELEQMRHHVCKWIIKPQCGLSVMGAMTLVNWGTGRRILKLPGKLREDLPVKNSLSDIWRMTRSLQGQRKTFLPVKNLLVNRTYGGWDAVTGARLTVTDLVCPTGESQFYLVAQGLSWSSGSDTFSFSSNGPFSVAWVWVEGAVLEAGGTGRRSCLCSVPASLWFSPAAAKLLWQHCSFFHSGMP